MSDPRDPSDPGGPSGPSGPSGPNGGADDAPRDHHRHHEQDVGSVSEEAAKLLGALGDWAKDQGHSYAGAAAAGAAGVGDALREVDRHLATGAEECRYCPICVVVARVRATSPEVRDHLSTAATSLLAAVAGMLATPVPDGAGRRGPVEKIDLAGDDTTEPPWWASPGATPQDGDDLASYAEHTDPGQPRPRRTRRACTDDEEPT